jgi:hypothetical protein
MGSAAAREVPQDEGDAASDPPDEGDAAPDPPDEGDIAPELPDAADYEQRLKDVLESINAFIDKCNLAEDVENVQKAMDYLYISEKSIKCLVDQLGQSVEGMGEWREQQYQDIRDKFSQILMKTLEITPEFNHCINKKRAAASIMMLIHEDLQNIDNPTEATVPESLRGYRKQAHDNMRKGTQMDTNKLGSLGHMHQELINMISEEIKELDAHIKRTGNERSGEGRRRKQLHGLLWVLRVIAFLALAGTVGGKIKPELTVAGFIGAAFCNEKMKEALKERDGKVQEANLKCERMLDRNQRYKEAASGLQRGHAATVNLNHLLGMIGDDLEGFCLHRAEWPLLKEPRVPVLIKEYLEKLDEFSSKNNEFAKLTRDIWAEWMRIPNGRRPDVPFMELGRARAPSTEAGDQSATPPHGAETCGAPALPMGPTVNESAAPPGSESTPVPPMSPVGDGPAAPSDNDTGMPMRPMDPEGDESAAPQDDSGAFGAPPVDPVGDLSTVQSEGGEDSEPPSEYGGTLDGYEVIEDEVSERLAAGPVRPGPG